jgi:aspartyl-tRNA(Asn)/glutamyl-tRNA(Gln) amidotransferase subunit A
MSERPNSTVGNAFDEAERTLHSLGFVDPRLAPPLSFVVGVPADPGSIAWGARWLPSSPSKAVGAAPTLEGPSLVDALTALEKGDTTSRELLESALDAARRTSELGTVVACDEAAARAEADQLDAERQAGSVRGPLHGLPITVKDVIDVRGLPTMAGSLAYGDSPTRDAAAVDRLRSSGALVFAKVATHEFALGVTTPQCRNPHDASRIAGGSSGGSAIAVATGVGVASLGTDTRASLRVPAALCGVVGFKPTFGRVPTDGVVPLSWTVDHVGPIARTVEDAAVVMGVLLGAPLASREVSQRTGTIGIVPDVFATADRVVADACETALTLLSSVGWSVRVVEGPDVDDLELANHLGLLITRAEAASFHRAQRTDLDLCIPEVHEQLEAGLTVTAADYLDAQRQRKVLADRTLKRFGECDIVASPTAPIEAPLTTDYERHLLTLSRYTIIWSLVGAPAVSVPCGTGDGGLPVALQLMAAPGGEQLLVDAGCALERQVRARR